MSEARGRRKRAASLFLDISPLRASPEFAKLWIGTSVAQIGAQVTVVAVGLHVYEITRSTFAVALVALWALGPMIIAGIVGGALADLFDRRVVALITASVSWAGIVTMTAIAALGIETAWAYSALAAVIAASATIIGAARGAIVPRLLPPRLLPAAAALNGITMGIAVTVGPAIAGVLVASAGFAWTYLLDAVLFSGAFLGILSLPPMRPERAENAPRPSPLGSFVDSLRFLRRAPNVRATFIFDLVAMTFGTPRVVYPAAGALVLGGGATTVGVLTSSFAIGALLSGLFSGPLGAVRRQGRAVTFAIAAFGAFTVCFGVVLLMTEVLQGGEAPRTVVLPALFLACVALAGCGASDNVSAVFRTTILQAAAPDDVRGRMQGIFYVVVAGGPRIGDLVAGALATVIAIWAPALVGGVLIVAIMLMMLRVYRGFQRYDALHPEP
ncbi:MFS transporter [Leucobacter sp. GX24907]